MTFAEFVKQQEIGDRVARMFAKRIGVTAETEKPAAIWRELWWRYRNPRRRRKDTNGR